MGEGHRKIKKPRRDEDVLRIGRLMSNVMFNLGQHASRPLNDHDREQMRMLQTQWDAAVKTYRESFKRRRESHG